MSNSFRTLYLFVAFLGSLSAQFTFCHSAESCILTSRSARDNFFTSQCTLAHHSGGGYRLRLKGPFRDVSEEIHAHFILR
jgi:hypothetical protein